MKINDERTEEQKKTHSVLIAATDTFMSNWGEAEGGKSMCAWAVEPECADDMERWIRSRPEMKNVKRVGPDWKPKSAAHVSIYVAEKGIHRALKGDA